MIKINLVPADEIENKYWYAIDLALLAALFLISYVSLDFYKKSFQEKLDHLIAEQTEIESHIKKMSNTGKKYELLQNKISELEKKSFSLSLITTSDLEKSKPIIALEIIQDKLPKGIWFDQLIHEQDNHSFQITGGAYDNLLISEFISDLSLISSEKENIQDVKSRIFFPKIHLEKVMNGKSERQLVSDNKEQSTEFKDVVNKDQVKSDKDVNLGANISLFPELSNYPKFEIRIQYDEKKSSVFSEKTEKSRIL